MRLFLRDYILSLKEDRELDQLLVSLGRDIGLIPITTPEKGRQYGVDIAFEGFDFGKRGKPKTLFLFVVKQGDITRSNWSTEKTGVRATLEEILDVYLTTHLPESYKKLPVKIILCTNGDIKQNTYINWTGFVNMHSTKKISFDFWGIDKLTLMVEGARFPESVFPAEVFSLLRRTMTVLMDELYDYRHFYQLTEILLADLPSSDVSDIVKRLRLLNTTYAMVIQMATKEGNTKPGVIIGERLLLMCWQWINKLEMINEPKIVSEYVGLLYQKISIDRLYFERIKDSLKIENGLIFAGNLDENEYALICYEQIGLVASFGHAQLWLTDMIIGRAEAEQQAITHWLEASEIADHLGHLVEQNPGAWYPKFDEHCIEINMAMLLFLHTGYDDRARKWLRQLVNYLYYVYAFTGFLPLFQTNYEKLVSYKPTPFGKPGIPSSMLITTLAEWSHILKMEDVYHELRVFVEQYCKDVNLQLWFPDSSTEVKLYTGEALETGQSKTSIKLPKNFKEYEMEMAEENALFRDDRNISFVKENYIFLGHYAFRHFRTYVFPCYWREWLSTSFCFNPVVTLDKKTESKSFE